MRYTVRKLFFAWDFEKEEKWLNDMSAKGFNLVNVGLLKYVFEDNEKEEYYYKIELLDMLAGHPESVAYLRFMEDTGTEHVASLLRWVYFRRKASLGDFELYSDLESRIKHYKRIRVLFLALIPLNLGLLINNVLHLSGEMLPGALISAGIVALFVIVFYKISAKISNLKRESNIRE